MLIRQQFTIFLIFAKEKGQALQFPYHFWTKNGGRSKQKNNDFSIAQGLKATRFHLKAELQVGSVH